MAVPLPLSVKVTPVGSSPVEAIVAGTGCPVVVTVKVFALPTAKVAAAGLVIVATSWTSSVNGWLATWRLSRVATKVKA